MTLKDCINLLYNLMPQGLAWNREEDSNTYKLVSSLAVEICRMNDRLEDLLREFDPFQTDELLADFEAMLGLPDECLGELELSIPDRRRLVIAALSALGGSTKQYFEALIAALGYTADVIDFTIARCGEARCGDYMYTEEQWALCGSSFCGDYMYNSGWQFWFKVESPDIIADYALCGTAVCGDRIATYGNEKIECIIRKLKPAHTAVWFTYS